MKRQADASPSVCEECDECDECDDSACGSCGDAFKNAWSRQKRAPAERGAGAKPHACKVEGCGKRFKQKSALKQHMADMHDIGVVWHYCEVEGCDERFKQKSTLMDHMADKHDIGVVWHYCEVERCDERFKRKSTLKQHMVNMHDIGVVWHHCEEKGCGKRFKRKSTLKQHMAFIHDVGVVWHACDVGNCKQQFKERSNLMVHIKRLHNEEFVKRKKEQEERVSRALVAAGYKEWFATANVPPVGRFKREKRIDQRCADVQSKTSYSKIDFVLSLPGGLVFLEVDENQHQYGYDALVSCDMKRMAQVMESLFCELGEALPSIYWLRYNPGAYRVDGDLVRVPKEERERRLVSWLRAFEADPRVPLEIGYAFYDREDGALEVLANEHYAPQYAEVARDLGALCP